MTVNEIYRDGLAGMAANGLSHDLAFLRPLVVVVDIRGCL